MCMAPRPAVQLASVRRMSLGGHERSLQSRPGLWERAVQPPPAFLVDISLRTAVRQRQSIPQNGTRS